MISKTVSARTNLSALLYSTSTNVKQREIETKGHESLDKWTRFITTWTQRWINNRKIAYNNNLVVDFVCCLAELQMVMMAFPLLTYRSKTSVRIPDTTIVFPITSRCLVPAIVNKAKPLFYLLFLYSLVPWPCSIVRDSDVGDRLWSSSPQNSPPKKVLASEPTVTKSNNSKAATKHKF